MVLQTKSAVVTLIVCCIITISCNPNKKNIPLVSVDIQAIPVFHSENLLTLISSDSGNIHLVSAKIQQIFSNAPEPYSYYPEGIHVEQLDSLLFVIGDIVADTAYHYEINDLWHAIGNVVVKNIEGRIFETPELFWDRKAPQNAHGVFYTSQLVKVTEPDSTFFYGLEGFTADQSLTNIRFYKMTGEFNVVESDEDDSNQQDTISSDSIQIQAP